MKEFEHKGFKINVDGLGQFHVDSREDIPHKPTLAEIKESIDRMLKREHRPIKALQFHKARWDREYRDIHEVTVTSFVRGRFSGSSCWIKNKNGSRSKENQSDIYVDSKENREIMRRIIDLSKEETAIRKKIDAETRRLVSVGPMAGEVEEPED